MVKRSITAAIAKLCFWGGKGRAEVGQKGGVCCSTLTAEGKFVPYYFEEAS